MLKNIKYNKTLDEVKNEYGLGHLNFFYVPVGHKIGDNIAVCWCSLAHQIDGILPITAALELKYFLHEISQNGYCIRFLDVDELYTDIVKLRQDSMILSISNL